MSTPGERSVLERAAATRPIDLLAFLAVVMIVGGLWSLVSDAAILIPGLLLVGVRVALVLVAKLIVARHPQTTAH